MQQFKKFVQEGKFSGPVLIGQKKLMAINGVLRGIDSSKATVQDVNKALEPYNLILLDKSYPAGVIYGQPLRDSVRISDVDSIKVGSTKTYDNLENAYQAASSYKSGILRLYKAQGADQSLYLA